MPLQLGWILRPVWGSLLKTISTICCQLSLCSIWFETSIRIWYCFIISKLLHTLMKHKISCMDNHITHFLLFLKGYVVANDVAEFYKSCFWCHVQTNQHPCVSNGLWDKNFVMRRTASCKAPKQEFWLFDFQHLEKVTKQEFCYVQHDITSVNMLC